MSLRPRHHQETPVEQVEETIEQHLQIDPDFYDADQSPVAFYDAPPAAQSDWLSRVKSIVGGAPLRRASTGRASVAGTRA